MALLHFCLTIFNMFYGFFTKKNSFDFFYLFLIYAINLSWTFYDGECPMTYYHKKNIDPSYKNGDTKLSNDLATIFGKKVESIVNKNFKIISTIGIVIFSLSFYLVMIRQKFPTISIFILIFITGSYCITINNNMHFHSFYRILLIGCLLYIFSMYLKSK